MKYTLSLLAALLILALQSCSSTPQGQAGADAAAADTAAACAAGQVSDSQVQVLYLHGARRCRTCIAVGKYSKELVDSLALPDVVWREVDLTTPDGEALGDRYEITGSGLVIAKGDRWENLTSMAFSSALADTPRFKAGLQDAIHTLAR